MPARAADAYRRRAGITGTGPAREPGEAPGVVIAFLKQQNLIGEAVRLDVSSHLGVATGSKALPTTLFIDADGTVVSTHSGEISRAALLAGLRNLERRPA